MAPLLGDPLGAMDHRRDIAARGTGALAVDGDDGVAQLDSVHVAGAVGGDGETPAEEEMGESSERVDVRPKTCHAVRRELQAHGRHRDERTRDEQHHMKHGRLEDHVLAAVGIDMDMGGEGNVPM